MKMSEKMAVRLHRMMWSDMQRELGDNPSVNDRLKFKHEWVKRNFPGESIANDCWLCEYATFKMDRSGDPYCKYCPIKWPNCHCNSLGFSYAKVPISEILALPAKNEEIEAKHDEKAPVRSYYQYREDLLSKDSGLHAICAIDDHVKAIKEKAVEEYFEKTPGAKLATMDVDEAFKQYADEQKAPIFNALSKQSNLDRNRPVDDHIREIVKNSMEAGAAEERDRIQEKIYEVLLS